MAGRTAKIILSADSSGVRRASDDLQHLSRRAKLVENANQRLHRSFTRLKIVTAAAAGAAAGLFVRGIIRNTIAQQDAVEQLNQTLKSTGRFTEEASQALQNHASALQQVTTYGDEAIISAQSQLATFKQLGGEVFPQATEAVLDMATKMGGDLKGAVVLLGKALNDPATGLSYLTRVGVTFSDQQKKVIKDFQDTNQLAEAQGLILKELQSEFGGSARAARTTLGGAVETLKNNFGDLLEVSGDDSQGVVKSINDLADTLARPETKEGFQNLAQGALQFVSAIAQAPDFVGFLVDELKELFGIIDNQDFVRRDEEIEELEKDLEKARRSAEKWWQGENSAAGRRAAALEKEIEEKKKLLEADRALAAERNKPGKPTVEQAAADVAGTLGTAGDPSGGVDTTSDERERQRVLNDSKTAAAELRQMLRDFAAEQGGPLVEANQAYEDSLTKIAESEADLLAAGELTAQQEADLQAARENALITRNQTIEAIRAEIDEQNNYLTPAEQVLNSIKLELELNKLSNVERQKKIALINAETDGTTELGQEIVANIEALNAQEEGIALMDGFRASAVDAFTSIVDGSKSAKEGFKDFMKSITDMLIRFIAQKLIEQAFGSFGSSGGGFGTSIASFFGGTRDTGGRGEPGQAYVINPVAGPEVFIPDSKGTFIPNADRIGAGTNNVTVNIDARETDNPARLLSLIPVIQSQIEESISLKNRRGIL